MIKKVYILNTLTIQKYLPDCPYIKNTYLKQ